MVLSPNLRREWVCLILIFSLSLIIVPSLVSASSTSPASVPHIVHLQGDQVAVLNALEVQLNAHNVDRALALFADDALVYDPTTISCHGGTGYLCTPGELFASYTSQSQIRGWLQNLAQVNIEVREVGSPQTLGNNVTWSWQVSNDGYRGLNIAPLVGNGEAVVNGNLIKYLYFRLSTDSLQRLQAALATYSRSPFLLASESIGFGLVALGLVFPGVAVYYVSRVKRLFATVPNLDKPWIMLGAGLASIFVSVLVVALREFAGLPPNIFDPLFVGAAAFSSFFVMLATVLMKRVMVSESNE